MGRRGVDQQNLIIWERKAVIDIGKREQGVYRTEWKHMERWEGLGRECIHKWKATSTKYVK